MFGEVYMKLYDKILRASEKLIYEEDSYLRADLLKAKVFDITSILSLEQDWHKEKVHSVPKRPPFDITWVEWKQEKDLESGQRVIGEWGVLLVKISKSQMIEGFPNSLLNFTLFNKTFVGESFHIDDGWDEFYIAKGFADIQGSVGCDLIKTPLALGLREDTCGSFYCLRKDSAEAEALEGIVTWDQMEAEKEKRRITNDGPTGAFGLVRIASMSKDGKICPFINAVPGFLAFALLYCKNVVTETVYVPEKLQKATIKRGHPKLCEYNIIKLKLVESKVNTKGESDGIREIRMHMVRGHFKNLQSMRYREKGWHWWPAHARGNPELGMVQSGYEVKQ